jgi:flagellar transcriptional activator FlhD
MLPSYLNGVSVNIEREGVSVNSEMFREIGDINLAYMLLAQKLVKHDKAAAMFRLGIGDELADLLANMTLAQIVKLASSNLLLCSFRLEDNPMFAVMGQQKDGALQQAHMSILMAARQQTLVRTTGVA